MIIRLPLWVLEHTPFHDFFIPGLLLAGVVGGANTVAGVVALRRSALANRAAFCLGGILVTWIVVEMLLLQDVHWLHGAYPSGTGPVSFFFASPPSCDGLAAAKVDCTMFGERR